MYTKADALMCHWEPAATRSRRLRYPPRCSGQCRLIEIGYRQGGPAGHPHCSPARRDVSGAMNTRSCGLPGEGRHMNHRKAKAGALLDAREWREFPR